MSTNPEVVHPNFPLTSASSPCSAVRGCNSATSHETLQERSKQPRRGATLVVAAKSNRLFDPGSIEHPCPPSSTPKDREGKGTRAIPSAITRDPWRKMAWMKARAQQARDRLMRGYSDSEISKSTIETTPCFGVGLTPKRQRSAFVKEEELNCLLEDRVGTPHISELQLDEDVTAHLNVQELGLAGAVNMLVDGEEQRDMQSEMGQ